MSFDVKHRYRERCIRTFKDLKVTVEALDPDEGVRILGSSKDLRGGGFIFIAKKSNRYCVNITERIVDERLGEYIPGGREEWLYLQNAEDVMNIVKDKAARPLKAWVY